ncbi:MAG: bifunctional metallophosphatase/5'-nucleotidase [Bacillota bacterium]|jgi:5'-nucleotidase/UDP-sugar diphosphatase
MIKRLSAILLALLLVLPPLTGTAAPADTTWHVNWMQEAKLVRGRGTGLELDAIVTRAEMAAFLQRVLEWPTPTRPTAIADVDEDHWAYEAIQAALAKGALELEDGRANPAAQLSAAEAVAIAERAGLILDLPATAKLSRGQLLEALGEAVTVTLTIVHTNDTHGRILTDDANGLLGWERVATIIEWTRRENPHTLVLDAGDAIHGTNEVQLFGGATAVNIMNTAGVDVMAPGNHEFNYGQDALLALAENAAFELISANVLKDGENLLTPYVIRELGGIRLAIIGFSTPETPTSTHPKNVVGLTFADPIATATDIVAELEDVDCIIALTHLGYGMDELLAEAVPEIDLIIGGHSHTEQLEAIKVNETYLAQTGEHTKYVGRQNLIFYQGQLVDVISTPVSYDASIPASPRTSKLAQTVAQRVTTEMGKVIGQTLVELDGVREHVRLGETNLGNLITDIMREATGADVALMNGGGIRASIAAGEITMNDIKTVLPFGNTLATVDITGAQLLEVLEHGVRLYPEASGGFPHVSGVRFTFDPSLPAGERVVAVTVGGKELDLEAVYTVATNDFLAAGGDGFTAFAAGENLLDTGDALDYVVIQYIQAHSEGVNPVVDGRIEIIGD